MAQKSHRLQLVASPYAGNSTEQSSFSSRLQQALTAADYAPDSPTQLAREFNIRFAGHSVTIHAARKWLVGEAIPTQEKLRTLAQWLNVPAEWLRFGEGTSLEDVKGRATNAPRIPPDIAASLEILQRLDDHHREIAQQMLRTLLQASARQTTDSAAKVTR